MGTTSWETTSTSSDNPSAQALSDSRDPGRRRWLFFHPVRAREGTSPAVTSSMAHQEGERWGKLPAVLSPPVLPQHGKDVGGRKNSPLSSEGNLGDRLLGRHLRTSQQDHPLPHRFVLWASSRDGQCQGKSPPPRREPGGGGGSKVCAHPPFRCLFLSFPSPQGSRGEACVSQAHSNPDWVTVQNVKCCLLGRRLVNTKSCW